MANPQDMTDVEYIVHLEDENKTMSDAMHKMVNECQIMLFDKDRAMLEKCAKCGRRFRR